MTTKPQKTNIKKKEVKKTAVKKTTSVKRVAKVAPKKAVRKKRDSALKTTPKKETSVISEQRKILYRNVIATILAILAVIAVAQFFLNAQGTSLQKVFRPSAQENEGGINTPQYPLTIEYMRQQEYSGSNITIEQTLPPGSNYDRYIASYKSDGLKIYALLTIPQGERPESGFPVIIFNHGYIPPAEYRTNERYVEYTDAFSRNGYIVFRSDYRGHGNSEGNPEGGYYSPAYTIDVLNAVSSIKKLTDPLAEADKTPIVDIKRMGMWGHSMGGHLTLRTMVTTKDIKAGVIWAGVVADYNDLDKNWTRAYPFVPSERELAVRRITKQQLIDQFGTVAENPQFWNSIAPISYVSEISGPMQIHHGTSDGDVPVLFSERLDQALKEAKKPTELYVYQDDDHNLSLNLYTALDRSVAFFDKHLK